MARGHLLCLSAFLMLVSPVAGGQEGATAPESCVTFRNQEVRVSDLQLRTAESPKSSAVLVAALEAILHDKDLCCGRASALEGSTAGADPLSLKDVGTKLQGRHLLSDGRPISVTAEYVPHTSTDTGQIVGSLLSKRALLMEWNSHLYVLYGVLFDETRCSSGRVYAISKLFLLDARFADSRREVSFNRATDDWDKVQGLLFLDVTPQ